MQVEAQPKVRFADLSERVTQPWFQIFYGTLAIYWGEAGILVWSNFYGPFLSFSELVVGIGYALWAVSPRGLLVGSDFATVKRIQRILSRSYLISGLSLPLIVAIGAFLRFPGLTPRIVGFPLWPPLIFVLGIAFFIVGISLPWIRVFEPDAEGRLCLSQFLAPREGSELHSTWLREGLRLVQGKMSRSGLSMPENTLFLGASYGLANGSFEDSDVSKLVLWLGEDGPSEVPEAAITLVSLAKEAEDAGYERRHPWIEHLFGTRNLLQKAVTLVAGSLAILVYLHSLGLF